MGSHFGISRITLIGVFALVLLLISTSGAFASSSHSASSSRRPKLLSFRHSSVDGVYDSFNGFVYTIGASGRTQLVFPSNRSVVNLGYVAGGGSGDLTYSPSNGTAFQVSIEGDIGCDVGIMASINGRHVATSFASPGLSGSIAYDNRYHYLAFGLGAYNDDGQPGRCGTGLFILKNNSSSYLKV